MKKSTVRKCANYVSVCLIIYTLLRYLIFAVEPLCRKFYVQIRESDPAARQQLLEQLEANAYRSGVSSIVIVILGVLLLLLLFRKTVPPSRLFHKEKKLAARQFPFLLCVFMSGQLIFSLFGNGIEALLNLCGYTAMGQLTAASSQSTTLSMFLYSAFFAPVAEELIYRGFVLRSFQKYGKVFAILLSATLFSIMHGNLFQMIFAFLVGIVLGYTALEYSIRWSILLHIINNFVFGELLGWLFSEVSPMVQDYLYRGINIAFFAVGSFFLLKHREAVLAYLRGNRTEKKCYRDAFTAIGMIVFLGTNLMLAFSGIHKLS